MIIKKQVLGMKYLADIEADITDGIDYKDVWRFDFCRPTALMNTIFNHNGDEIVADKIKKEYNDFVMDVADDRFDKLIVYGYIRGKELPIKLASVIATHRHTY